MSNTVRPVGDARGAKILSLLEEALAMLDESDLPPDIGALLQAVVDRVNEFEPYRRDHQRL